MPRTEAGPAPAWTLLVASLALMMSFLDALVVTTALPDLRAALHAGVGDLEWTLNAYNLAFACLLLTGAALGDRFGRRRMLCLGLGVFVAASTAAGLAGSVGVLVAARAVGGAGAALMVPLTLTLVVEAYPAERRGRAIGIWMGVGGLSGAIGPFVGGALVEAISWHWIFWINVPIGLALIPIALAKVKESRAGHPRLDLVGVALASAGLFGVTWGIVRTDAAGWGSAAVLGPIALGLVVLGCFSAWEARTRHPMVPLEMFRGRRFTAANGISFCLYAGLFGSLFLMSQFFQTAQGCSPLQAGAELLAWSATGLVVAPLAGRGADRFGNRPFILAGLLMQAIGLGAIASIAGVDTSFLALAPFLLIAGSGTALVFPTVTNEVMGAAAPERAGIASGINSSLRELGGVFGVAVLASVFSRGGVFVDPVTFVAGFHAALWVAVAFTVIALPLALSLGGGVDRGSEATPAVAVGPLVVE
ncbi:MAG TPA: MFS transporter [Solirubrobacterales bacterium]|nr:MFS transporter [Solirubrobacterales bacterium]